MKYSFNATATKEILSLLLDRQWHEIYELHEKYRLSPADLVDAIKLLLKIELIKQDGRNIKIVDKLDERRISLMNRLLKSKRPTALENYIPNKLTHAHRYVS